MLSHQNEIQLSVEFLSLVFPASSQSLIPQTPVPWSPAPLSSALGQSPPHAHSLLISALSSARLISQNLFWNQPDGDIIKWLTHIVDQQEKIVDCFNALISVLSGNPESASPLPEEQPPDNKSLNLTPHNPTYHHHLHLFNCLSHHQGRTLTNMTSPCFTYSHIGKILSSNLCGFSLPHKN